MNPHLLKRLFPNASRAVLQANAGDYGSGQPDVVIARRSVQNDCVSITIHGQIRGGKNNMIVTKRGKHVPKKEWATWRDTAVEDVRSQLPLGWNPISQPSNVRIDYVSGDKRRRDFPAICDAIWHVLERSGFVTDDTLLWPSQSTRSYDKKNPHAKITILK